MELRDMENRLKSLDELGRYELFLGLYQSRKLQDQQLLKEALTGQDPFLKMLFLQYLEETPERPAVQWILLMLKDGNEIVSQAAFKAYNKNTYTRKARLLRPYLRDPNPEIACFAIRTLVQCGDFDILPTLLSLLPESPEVVRNEILWALRFLPDLRSIPPLRSFAEYPSLETRYRALKSLAELSWQGYSIPVTLFLKAAQDSSVRIRGVALFALQRYPSEKIARLFLRKALGEESVGTRQGAVQALASFPRLEWIRPLMEAMAHESNSQLRLTAEITLKRFPKKVLKKGLLSLLDHQDAQVRQQGARLLAEIFGAHPDIRKRLIGLWHKAEDASQKLSMIEVLRELGTEEVYPLLYGAMEESPLLAYAAAGVLNRLWIAGRGLRILSILRDPKLTHPVKQALLSALTKRAPDEITRSALLPYLLAGLEDPVTNIRYLSLQNLGWYPLADTLEVLLRHMIKEKDETTRKTALRLILKGLGRNPGPLLDCLKKMPEQDEILPHALNILTAQAWDVSGLDLLATLASQPIVLLSKDAGAFFTIALHWLERGFVTLQEVYSLLPLLPLRKTFWARLQAAYVDPKRHFPPLPLDFLNQELAAGDAQDRSLLYSLIAANHLPEGIAYLTGYLLREDDESCFKQGSGLLRQMIWEPA